jgi:hypothetical protein
MKFQYVKKKKNYSTVIKMEKLMFLIKWEMNIIIIIIIIISNSEFQ